MRAHHIQLTAGFTLGQRLTDANNGNKIEFHGPLGFLIDQLIGLFEIGAAFRMAENNVTAADILQHERRNLSGESAFGLIVHILGAQINHRVLKQAGDGVNGSERRAYHDFNI